MLAIGIKKLCRAQNVPGLVFVLIASPCWQLAFMLCGPLYWHPSWHSSWCWRWRLFSPIQRVSVMLAFARACILLAFAYASVVLAFAQVSVVLVFAQVSVMQAFARASFCCRAGVCTGVHRAAIRAGICRVCWCRILVLCGWRHH